MTKEEMKHLASSITSSYLANSDVSKKSIIEYSKKYLETYQKVLEILKEKQQQEAYTETIEDPTRPFGFVDDLFPESPAYTSLRNRRF